MAITPSDFSIALTPSPIKVVLGKTGNLNMSFYNSNPTDSGYNLYVNVVLPNGVSYSGSSIPPTSITTGPSNTIILNWVNITDLPPNSVAYNFDLQVQSDTNFRGTGLPVPFDVPISTITMIGNVDTLPRGNDDEGNVIISKSYTSNLIPNRYNIKKSSPTKMPKGAGLLNPPTSSQWPYTYTLTLENNIQLPSTITLIDNLPNGVRYLGGLSVTGPDNVVLSTPTVIYPYPSQDFTSLDWGSVTLSANSFNTITFSAAIWDNYTIDGVENSGDKIPHGTQLTNSAILNGDSGTIVATSKINAMDATIDKSVSPSIFGIGTILTYTLNYRINQYDNIQDFIITDVLANGQSYNSGSASVAPTSVTVNLDGTTTIIWEIGDLSVGTTGTITFTSTVNSTYSDGSAVLSNDSIANNVDSNGLNETTDTTTPDSSSANTTSTTPTISKSVLNYYYKDGSLKPYSVAAPGDLVEFRIDYDASSISTEQKNITIDEYAPLNMGPLTGILPVTYGGTLPGPFLPFTVSPNGLRWSLGTLPGNTTWSAIFKIPVLPPPFVGTKNNLVKLSGINTQNIAYGDRDQIEVNFGEPNIQFDKTVSPTTNPVSSGQLYTYSITISNPQTPEGFVTDAFNMSLTDIIPTGMTYTGTFSVTGTGTYNTPVFAGQNISMLITKLAPNQSLTLNYQVSINGGAPAGSTLNNNATLQRPYSQADSSYQYVGAPFVDSVTKDVVSLSITKTASITTAKVGDDITYTITVVVPTGTIAYTPQVSDVLPSGQTYQGPATRQVPPGSVTTVTPTVIGQTVTFNADPDIDATTDAVTIIYTFVARVTSAPHVPPFQQVRTNRATVNWAIVSGGPYVRNANSSYNVTVTTPNIIIIKDQRNATTGESFTNSKILASPNDVIQYRLTVISNGASPAYNINISDILSDRLTFGGIIIGPTIGTVTPPGPPPSATLTWNIPLFVNGGATDTLVFSAKFANDPVASEKLTNQATGTYDSNNVNPVTYNADSPIVTVEAIALLLNKSASKTVVNIGDTITYVLKLTIPPNLKAYNVVVSDTLPIGQSYAGNAKINYITVTPMVTGQLVIFPVENMLTALGPPKIIIYSFNATVDFDTTPFPATQINNAKVNWDITPSGPAATPVNANISITVNDREPYRGIGLDDTDNAYEIIQGNWI